MGDRTHRFGAIVFALFFIIVRGTRFLLGPRRRLDEQLGEEVLGTRLARGEFMTEEHDEARRALRR